MRLINADALKYLYCPIAPVLEGDEVVWRFILFDSDIDHAPTIDAVPRWIPCEERLPEKEEKAYLVYLDNGHVCECRWWCLDPVFLKPTDNWRWHLMDKPQYTKVLAWMPLPEPYEEERSK